MATTADGALVEVARAGDERAFGQLFDAWFDRVHDVSRRIVRDDGIAGEVAQDTFLRAWTKLDTLDDVDAFGGWVLRIGRNASLNRLEKERRSTVLDDDAMTTLTDAASPDHDPLARLDQAGRIALVWDAAAALGERDASVLDLHLRHGLGAAELAEELGTNANNAHQVLFTLRKRLGNAVRALVLWRAGHPTCADLRSALAAAGLTSFGAPMVKAIDRHVDRCDECARDRTERISPAALFAAAPIVAAPALLKAEAASALAGAGVPMSGSASASASAGAAGSAVAGPTATPFPDPGIPAAAVGGAIGGGGAGAGHGPAELAGPSGGDGAGDGRSALAKRRLAAAVVVALACLGGLIWWAAAGAGDDEDVVSAAAPGSTAGDLGAPDATSSSTSLVTTTSDDTTPRSGPSASTSAPELAAPTTAPAAPGSTDPGAVGPGPGSGTAPPATNPPASTAPTTTVAPSPTTTRPAPTTTIPAPVVDGFRATASTTICRGGYQWTLVWQTTGADSVQVGPSTGTAAPGHPDGRAVVCAPANSSFTLAASGPGGTTIATVQGRGPASTTPPIIVN